MTFQVYECPEHGEYTVPLRFSQGVPKTWRCPANLGGFFCDERSKHIIKPIAAAIVRGGTGGGKDMHSR